MQTTIHKMNWQTEPTKNMVTNSPSKVGSKFERSEKTRQDLLETLQNIIKNPPYPDYRFSCPLCGSLDVFITINDKVGALAIDCLDCEKMWFEEKVANLEVTNCHC